MAIVVNLIKQGVAYLTEVCKGSFIVFRSLRLCALVDEILEQLMHKAAC